VATKARREICRELGISPTTLSQILSDKYGASTTAIEDKIFKIYGADGKVTCPMLGEIDPGKCADHFEKATKIRSPGNPATIRLYMACRKCEMRG
jgi:transcriptional regulator with XRE-family HTH domain